MSKRPEILYPLFAGLETLDGIGPKSALHLQQIGIEKPRDLLLTLPYSGTDRTRQDSIRGAELPGTVTVEIEVGKHYPPQVRGRPYRVHVTDEEESFQLVFFHARGDYVQKILPTGQRRIVSGKLEMFDGIAQMPHPDYILRVQDADTLPSYEPIYPLTAGITQKTMAKASQSALTRAPEFAEWIDPALKQRENWPDWSVAINAAHMPKGIADLSPDSPPRQRLAYDELFAHQLTLALARSHARQRKGVVSHGDGRLQKNVLQNLPYAPTQAQNKAISEILADMAQPIRMNRLLQGDVGSGKTLVALMALLAGVEAGGQSVMMAPTEILARQHLDGLRPLAANAGVELDILTGRDTGAERRRKLDALKNGQLQVLVGTHAVFQKDVNFKDLRLIVVDEQHRFGVRQRLELSAKGLAPDVLVMTATPIPRSLALAQYGDMDVSVLDEKPPGRTPVTTALVSDGRIGEVINHLRRAVEEGRQAYWVCPLVEESERVDLTAAEARFKSLRAELGEGQVGLVHGQLLAAEKDAAMSQFVSGNCKVLVATTAIEVGVNVPNASIMVIERAETFGLAQLHQLRGRVGRGSTKSTCLMMFKPPLTETARRRLEILRETEDGFRISEEDLALRGAGDVIGTAQSGIPKFRIADLERQSGLMAIAQSDARKLLSDDPDLTSDRGQAVRVLLWLMEQDKAIKLISVG